MGRLSVPTAVLLLNLNMTHNAYPLFLRRALLWLAAFFAFGSVTSTAFSATVTQTGEATFHVTWPAVSGDWQVVRARKVSDMPDGPIAWEGAGNTSSGTWAAGSGDFEIPPGEAWMVSWYYGVMQYGTSGPYTPTPSYGITVNLPANTTPRPKLYFAMQNGEQVGWAQQASGQSAREWYIGGLETDAEVLVVEVTGGQIAYNDGNWIKTADTDFKPVSTSTEPSPEPTPGSGATAETTVSGGGTQPPPTSTPTETPDAPTPTETPDAPTGTSHPDSPTPVTPLTPSGGSAVTKADAETILNKELEGLAEVAETVHEGAVANVEATDKVAEAVWEAGNSTVEATDAVAEAVWESGIALVDAVDSVAASVDAAASKIEEVRDSVDAVAVGIDTTNAHLEEIKEALESGDTMAAEHAAIRASDATAIAAASGSSAAAVTAFQGLLPSGVPTELPHDPDVSGSGSFMEIEMPVAFGGATVNFNPFSEGRMGGVAAWFRSATAWLTLMLLAYAIFEECKQFFIASAAARQAQGNPVLGGTGAQGTALIAAGLITALFVVLVTSLMSYAFGDITLPTLISNMSVDPLTAAPANMLWFLNQFLPLATLLSAFVMKISFRFYGMGLYGGFLTAIRWVVP